MIIRNNRVFVKPIKDDLKALTELLDSSPFEMVKDEDLSVTIIYSQTPIYDFKPLDDLHISTIQGVSVDYDPYYGIKSLVIALDAPSLIARREEIIREYDVEPMYPDYNPHMTLVYNVPPVNRQRYRWWMNAADSNFNHKHKGSIIRLRHEAISSSDTSIFGVPITDE